MSILYYFIDEETRKLRPEAAHKVVAQKDHNADVIRVGIPETMDSVDLETSAVRCMYQRPKETEVRSKTATYYDTSGGYLWYDWTLQEGDTAKAGKINFSVCLQHIEGGLLTVDWNTTIGEIFVKTSYHSDDGDEADESITPTVAQRVAVLESMLQRVASGAPIAVSSSSEMTDTNKIYVLTTDSKWYYYDGSAWAEGGTYGAVATDKTLTHAGLPADAEVVGTRFGAVEADVEEISGTVDELESDVGNLITTYKSANLFDKSQAMIGYYFYPQASDSQHATGDLISNSITACAYVPIDGIGNYSMRNVTQTVGVYWGKNVVLFDENKESVVLLEGTLDSSDNTITHFTITPEHLNSGAVYIGFSFRRTVIDTAMCVKSSTYPSEYIEYYEYTAIDGYIPHERVVGLPAYVESAVAPVADTAGNAVRETQRVKDYVDSLVHEDVSENLFDKTAVLSGSYFNLIQSQTSAEIGSDASMNAAYVPIRGSGNYTCKVETSFFGTYVASKIPLFNGSKECVVVVTGTLDSNDNTICHFTITDSNLTVGAVYIGYSVRNRELDTAMIVKSDTYPTEYIPYANNGVMFLGNIDRTHVINLADEHEKTANLFDYDDVTFGYYFSVSGSGAYNGLTTAGNMFISYVPITEAGNYSWKNAKGTFGTYIVKYVPVFDENKEYLLTITGTVDSSDNSITHFSVTAEHIVQGAKYFGYSVRSTDIGQAMIVKSDTYPTEYIPYSEGFESLDDSLLILPSSLADNSGNVLYRKKAVFDGDSICQDGAVGGWAKIIGSRNSMYWQNAGVAGGTITAETYYSGTSARHWVSRSIDEIYSEFPELDYLILEGGTNDADLLTNDQIGTIDPTNWTTFDDTTFIGALESLFFKALNYYPTAKIGFIIAQKMGVNANYGYDSGDSPSTRRRRKFFEAAISVCKKWGIPYIDLWESCPICPKLECYYDSTMTADENTAAGKAYIDGQHLTPVGYDIVSSKIEAWMKTL